MYIYHDTGYLASLCCTFDRLDEYSQLVQVLYATEKIKK